jgi:hypothetical protein
VDLEKSVFEFIHGLSEPWFTMFEAVSGIDLRTAIPLDLIAPCAIDRTQPGFADFDLKSRSLITPGDPASSLIYHAFASPLVKPAGAEPASYPTIESLDLIENYILSLAPLLPSAIPHDAVVAVFAYEYRPAPSTTHRRRADFVYSRSGFSRIGETAPFWDSENRCWLNIGPASQKFAVMPARYAAFLAVPRKRSPNGISVLGDPDLFDNRRTFFLPVRKLFDGTDCIVGTELKIEFDEFHRREKLRRIFTESDLAKPPGLDLPPYLRDSTQAEPIVQAEPVGASILISSPPADLVRLARLPNGDIASFDVPPRRSVPLIDFSLNRDNGASSTFMIITGGLAVAGIEAFLQSFANVSLRPRNAPEFVNMRHMLTGDPGNPIQDLSMTLGDDFDAEMVEGDFKAALFDDSIADGCVVAKVRGLPTELMSKPAFSVIGAPRFFQYADEIDLEDWVEAYPSHNRKDQFKEGGPTPLNLGRFPPNLTLVKPGTQELAFLSDDEDAVAIVGQPYVAGTGPTQSARPQHKTTTYLSDGCSDVFAPGWDVTFAEVDGTRCYTTFGLGSPFPEDVKLCAAANAYWPAASPDAARTFNHGPTAIPLLDAEVGYHPDNPRRPGDPTFGWDGEQGPFIDGNAVNYASIARSDYVSHAFADRTFSGALLKDVDSKELIARMDALRLCIQSLPEDSARVDHTKLWLVHADKALAPPEHVIVPDGVCYRYEFVVPKGFPTAGAERNRLLRRFGNRYVCYVNEQGVSWATSEEGQFTFVENPGDR